ncbi:MAG: helix-turn-helix domain-containing protein, partial [Pseudomonadota bacterium]
IRTCHHHRVYLHQNTSARNFREAIDFQSFLGELPANEEVRKIRSKLSSLEAYILRRVSEDCGNEWLDQLQLHVVVSICEALGALINSGSECNISELSNSQKTQAGCLGFQIASNGIDAISAELDRYIQSADRDRVNYSKILKPLHSCLQSNRNDPEFAEIIGFFREFILDRFYVPFCSSLIGQTLREPKLVTPSVAAKKYDVPLSLLRRQLKLMFPQESKTSKTDTTLPATLFSLEDMQAAVSEVRKLSSLSVCRLAIGAERYLMEGLAAEGVIKTHFPRGDGAMPVIHETELLEFIAKLQSATTHVGGTSDDDISFAQAASSCHCTTVWIIDQALKGSLPLVSVIKEPYRLDDFLVPLAKLQAILVRLPPQMVSIADAAKLLGYRGATVQALARAGLLPSKNIDSRLANRARVMFHLADIERFSRKYVRLRGLNGERRKTFLQTQQYVLDCGVHPITIGTAASQFYLRSEIEEIANQPGGERLARLLHVDELRQITRKNKSG